MRHNLRPVWYVAVALVLACVLCTVAQNVLPNQQRTVTQVEPAGQPLTTQTAFCQTSTGGAQANTVTIAALAGKTIYVEGLEVTGSGATGALDVTVTVAFGGTTVANYTFVVPAGATLQATPLILEYTSPLVAPTVGTSCVVTVGSFGTGNTGASVAVHGFYE